MKIAEGAVVLEPGSSARYETGNWRTFRPVVDPKKCTSCGICWLYCPDIAIGFVQKGKPAEIDYRYCKGCGICANECPVKAITMISEERS